MNLKYDLNKNQDRKIEILAPAGSYESFHAAIVAGADAVYAGGPKFGARAFAENFTKAQLLNAIDYAHLHQRKFYLTVNTSKRAGCSNCSGYGCFKCSAAIFPGYGHTCKYTNDGYRSKWGTIFKRKRGSACCSGERNFIGRSS